MRRRAAIQHRLIDGRPSKWSPDARTHLVGDGPKSVLEEPMTLCGKYVSGRQHTGPLVAVTCTSCLRSIERQMSVVR